jgi:16S rRNA (uracil1498-N3)-methyltransferase
MSDFRVYCLPTETAPNTLRLSAEESHHLVVVNRARRGDAVIAIDGRGTEWDCELIVDSKNAATLAVRDTRRAPLLPHVITLAQALPKGPVMDSIVRKATEIGATRIVPLISERTQVHLDGERQDKKVEKWRTAALEAAKQCGNPWLPEIAPLQTFAAFLTAPEPHDLKLVASLHPGAKPLKTLFAQAAANAGRPPRRVLWLIGPEGDFTADEMTAALTAGFLPATLGTLVLRCETAATYALSVTAHELQSDSGRAS